MNLQIKEWIVDFMNLFLGIEDETEQYWHYQLVPVASAYFQVKPEVFFNWEKNMKALFFAFCFHFGVNIQQPEEFFQDFGNFKNPFDSLSRDKYQRLQIVGK